MGARLQTAREILHGLAGFALFPPRVLAYAFSHGRLTRDLLEDLDAAGEVQEGAELSPAALERLRAKPLLICISCAEPSGEKHARSLVAQMERRLRELGAPPPQWIGLGGQRLAAAGVELIADPVSRAAMGADVLRALPFYLSMVTRVASTLQERRPDLVLPVDSPALHVPLGRIARRLGLPVVHFVTPQYWAWAPWRVGGYRSAVDRALTILPFEPPWFARHGVPAVHVGHPLLDALEHVPSTRPRIDTSAGAPPSVALLPGSRESVIRRNLPWMLMALARVRLDIPQLRIVLPHDHPELEPLLASVLASSGADRWVELVSGDLHGTLGSVDAAFSVSGTVLLDLLHHRLPTVVIYRLKSRWMELVQKRALSVPFFASTNLLAGEELSPEYAFSGEGPTEEVAADLVSRLTDSTVRAQTVQAQERVAHRLGPAGAARRAADHALAVALADTDPRGGSTPPLRGGETPLGDDGLE